MDKRLELTEEQRKLAKKFDTLCSEMNRAGIGFINQTESLYLVNLNNVEKWIDPLDANPEGDENELDKLVDITEMKECKIKFFYITEALDFYMGIRYKKK